MDRAEHIERTHIYKLFPKGCPVDDDAWIWGVEASWVDRLGANAENDQEVRRIISDMFERYVGKGWRANDNTPLSLKYDLFEAYGQSLANRDPSAMYAERFKDWYINQYYGYLNDIGM